MIAVSVHWVLHQQPMRSCQVVVRNAGIQVMEHVEAVSVRVQEQA